MRIIKYDINFQNNTYEHKDLIAIFGWCIVYANNPDQIDSLISALIFGNAAQDLEAIIGLCKQVLKLYGFILLQTAMRDIESKKTNQSFHNVVPHLYGKKPTGNEKSIEEVINTLPADLREYVRNPKSTLMRFILIINVEMSNKKLANTLLKARPFL